MSPLTIGKKNEAGGAHPAAIGTPVEQVKTMREQGMPDNQVIQTLQRDGFNSSQIFDAMNQADLVSGGPQPMGDPSTMEMQPQQYMQEPFPTAPMEMSGPPESMDGDMDRIEELIEAIVDEKWDELIRDVNRIVDWKEKTETDLNMLKQRVDDIKQSFDQLNKMILGRIDGYDHNIKDVGAEIKAMEKVFQQILPTFTESVNELSRITKEAKKKE